MWLRVCVQAKHPNPKKEGQVKLVWGLTRCDWCGVLWDRDRNSALNILFAAMHVIAGLPRPAYLTAQYGVVAAKAQTHADSDKPAGNKGNKGNKGNTSKKPKNKRGRSTT